MQRWKNPTIVFAILIACVLIYSLTTNAKGLTWKPFSSSKGQFSILFPGNPTNYQKAKHTAVGNIGEEFYKYTDDTLTLTTEYSDIPGIARVLGGHQTIYKKSKDGFLKSVDGKEVSFSDFSVGEFKGKELVYTTATRNGKTLFVMVKKRLYVIQASIKKGEKDKTPLDKFIQSFKPTTK